LGRRSNRDFQARHKELSTQEKTFGAQNDPPFPPVGITMHLSPWRSGEGEREEEKAGRKGGGEKGVNRVGGEERGGGGSGAEVRIPGPGGRVLCCLGKNSPLSEFGGKFPSEAWCVGGWAMKTLSVGGEGGRTEEISRINPFG